MKPTHRSLQRIVFFLLAILLLGHSSVFAGVSRPDCKVCGMWIDQYRNTRHVLIAKDGSRVMFCSLTCASRYLKSHGSEMRQVQVADYLSTELVDACHAVYLAGSDVPPVMSNTSIIAFSRREQAEKFRQEHGGRILTYFEALALE